MSEHAATIDDLIDQHFDEVYAYVALRLAPHLDEAADITQEVFGAAVRDRPAAAAARAWLLRVARNKIADHYRRRARRNHEAIDVDSVEGDGAGSRHAIHDRERRERAVQVATVLRQLPPGQVDLLEDKYLRGLSVRQIADEQGSTPKAVESALSRAREAFRKAVSSIELAEGRAR